MPRLLIKDFGYSVININPNSNSGDVSMGNKFAYNDKVTVMGWFKHVFSSNQNNFPTLASKSGNTSYFLIENPSVQVAFNAILNGVEKSSGVVSQPLTSGVWNFIAGVYDKDGGSNNLAVYLFDSAANLIGSNQSTQTGTIAVNTGNFHLLHDDSRGYNIQGNVDEVSVWNRALSFSEIQYFAKNKAFQGTTSIGGYWKMDEAFGTVIADSSGNGNLGTIENTLYFGYSSDVVARPRTLVKNFVTSLSFDASTSIVSIPNSSSLNLNSTLSISAWVYPTSTGENTFGRVIDKNNGNTGYGLNIDADASRYAIALAGSSIFTNPGAVTMNKWSHIVMTWDGTLGTNQVKWYVNGNPLGVGQRTGTLPGNTDPLIIGNNLTNVRTWGGLLDDIRLYNRAITPQEVPQLYSDFEVTSGLVGYWKFDEQTGTVIIDSSGNQAAGTNVGATYSSNTPGSLRSLV